MVKNSELLEQPRYPKRTGMLKSSMNAKEERGPGRLPQYAWEKKAEQDLKAARKLKKEQRRKLMILTELDHLEEEQPGVTYCYSTHGNHDSVEAKPLKRKPFPP